MYSTLALEKERDIVKEETALRKEKEAVCTLRTCMYMYILYNTYIPVTNKVFNTHCTFCICIASVSIAVGRCATVEREN